MPHIRQNPTRLQQGRYENLQRGGDIEDDWAVGLTRCPLNIHSGQDGARGEGRGRERPCNHVIARHWRLQRWTAVQQLAHRTIAQA
jgi:hypothetical protein